MQTLYSNYKTNKILSIILTLLLTLNVLGCAQNGHVKNDYCLIAQPIYFEAEDRLSEDTEIAIIQHNEVWQQLCYNK